jgi:nicotinamidase/pyrazinamidase
MKVLLIVDPQRCFCPGGSLAVKEGDQVFPAINNLSRNGRFDLVVASKDWHPPGHVSFASSHPGRAPFEAIEIHGAPQMLWPDHAVAHSEGAEFHPDLDTSTIHEVILKGTNPSIDSYSAFFDNARRAETPLRALIERAATAAGERMQDVEIVVCGLALDYCVKFTALDAVSLGSRVRVVLDASRAVDDSEKGVEAVVRELETNGVKAVLTRELLPEFAQPIPQFTRDIHRARPSLLSP